jgi:hypothetical protein
MTSSRRKVDTYFASIKHLRRKAKTYFAPVLHFELNRWRSPPIRT